MHRVQGQLGSKSLKRMDTTDDVQSLGNLKLSDTCTILGTVAGIGRLGLRRLALGNAYTLSGEAGFGAVEAPQAG